MSYERVLRAILSVRVGAGREDNDRAKPFFPNALKYLLPCNLGLAGEFPDEQVKADDIWVILGDPVLRLSKARDHTFDVRMLLFEHLSHRLDDFRLIFDEQEFHPRYPLFCPTSSAASRRQTMPHPSCRGVW